MLAEGRDLPPVVADLLSALGRAEGIHGVLADGIEAPRELRAALEAHLGPLLNAVLVRDWKAVRTVRGWLDQRDEVDGITLLPLDPGPIGRPEGTSAGIAQSVEFSGPGEPWARALLGGVELDADGRLAPRPGAWVAADGTGQDERGVVRLGRPAAGEGTLRRRGERAELETRLASLRAELSDARDSLFRLTDLERELASAIDARRRAEDERDSVEAGLHRVLRTTEEIQARIGELEKEPATGGESPADEDERRARLEEARSAAEDVLARERAGHMSATAEWERENALLQDLRLDIARREASTESIRGHGRRLAEQEQELARRTGDLEVERESLLATIEESRTAIAGSEEELVGLLEARTELAERVREAQEGLDVRRTELEERESALRTERQAERDASERRHALELEVAQLRGGRANIRERLEAEWETAFEDLRERVEPPEGGDSEEWASELEAIRARLVGIGPVNLLATQEYEEEKSRLDFLDGQKSDLEKARNDLHDSIRRINEAASAAFSKVFGEVRENFRNIFDTLFEGGDADVWLENPDDPLDSVIEISASPRGKRTQRIHLLSGGERALTALALVFAIYLTKPSPFCVMDEVDAPLDETNIGRFTSMLERFKSDTQFIIITHNARTIEAADWIYGVTMQEPGVSTLVGIELQDLPRGQVA
jgi:chromosome segregation protein